MCIENKKRKEIAAATATASKGTLEEKSLAQVEFVHSRVAQHK